MWLFYLFFFFLFEVFLLNLFHPQVSLILWACMIDWFSSLFSTILLLFFHYNVLPLMLFNLSEIHVHFLLYNLLFLLYLARLSWDNLLFLQHIILFLQFFQQLIALFLNQLSLLSFSPFFFHSFFNLPSFLLFQPEFLLLPFLSILLLLLLHS